MLLNLPQILHDMGFERFVTEHGIYAVGEGADKILLAVYVDDLLII